MRRDRLHRLLEELHHEVASAGALDGGTRRDLGTLADELRAVADGTVDAGASGLRSRLEGQVQRFQASHPALARALANLIDTLALYGL